MSGNTDVLKRMAAEEAWKELQEAYGLLYCNPPNLENLNKAEPHLKKCNEWLSALQIA